jgi:hypothetical protein
LLHDERSCGNLRKEPSANLILWRRKACHPAEDTRVAVSGVAGVGIVIRSIL